MTLALKLSRDNAATLAAPPAARVAPIRETLFSDGDLSLFAHMSGREARDGMARLCADLRLGAVYCAARQAQMTEIARVHRSLDGAQALFDRELYSGKARLFASGHDLDPGWVIAQRRLGFQYGLTDSGFIDDGDHTGLARTLGQASLIDGSIAALPVASKWVASHAAELVEAINRAGVPVALMLEHSSDPFGSARTVNGFLSILRDSSVPVLLLRSDTSAIGALANGAAHAAIGTSTSRRHIFPQTNGGPPSGPREPSAYVLSAMSYRKLSTINHAIAASADDEIPWVCKLPCCCGNRIDQITNSYEAMRHSLASQQALVSDVLADPRQASVQWQARSAHALSINLEMNSKIMSTWPVPAYLNAWANASR